MTRHRLWLFWGLLLVLGAAGEGLLVLNRATWSVPTDPIPIGTSFALTYGLAGTLILTRRRGHPMGRLFLLVTTLALINQLSSEYPVYGYDVLHANLPGAAQMAWFSGWNFYLVFPLGLTLMILMFPDGLADRRSTHLVAALAVAGCALLTVFYLGASGDISPSDRIGGLTVPVRNVTGFLPPFNADPPGGIGWLVSGIALIASVVIAVRRLQQATGEARQQLKWFAYFVAPVAPAFAAHISIKFASGITGSQIPDLAFPVYYLVFLLGIPVATGVAVLKYRLWDLDVVISRALVFGSLAVLITTVYVGIAVGIGSLVGSGGRPNLALSILATAIVAVGFQPVRERVQRVANRLVYGERATPYEVLSQFSERVAESYATDEVMPRMARVLAEGTGAQRADVWLRTAAEWREAAVWPFDALLHASVPVHDGTLPSVLGNDVMIPVRHQGVLLGALSVTKRGGETLTPVEHSLLTHLASQAGLVLKNVGLSADLQARLDDLRASRQRLVSAQDDERRRLERNLHDGAQQHLVAIKVKLGLAEILMSRDPAQARATLGQLKADADDALETLRDLARGIYPPLLADKGLAAALESQARKANLPVTVEAETLRRYPQQVEAAVYFCCLEAMQNIQKYANASRVTIHLREQAAELLVEVVDDGNGFDPAVTSRGAGLSNMMDRFDALGGEVRVTSTVGNGTRIDGRLPLTTA